MAAIKMKQPLITILLLVSGICSFGQMGRDISGLYGECSEGYFACEQIELMSDSTFEYGIFYDVGGWVCWKGRWTAKGDTVILNSYRQPKDSIDYEAIKVSYSFYQSGFIIDLKNVVKRNKLYRWDFATKSISKERFLKKTKIKNRRFKIDSKE